MSRLARARPRKGDHCPLHQPIHPPLDDSNLQGKLKKVQVFGSSSYQGENYKENELKGKEN